MIKVEWLKGGSGKHRKLGSYRFYLIYFVLRSVHVVSTLLIDDNKFLLNNFVDWDTVNLLYNNDFINKGTRITDYMKSLGKAQSRKRPYD